MIYPLASGFAFLTGVIVASSGLAIAPHFGLSFWALAFLFLFFHKKTALLFLCFFLGLLRVQWYQDHVLAHDFTPGFQIVEGVVSAEPDVRADRQILKLELNGQFIQIELSPYQSYRYGDLLTVQGHLELVELLEDENTDDAFSYRSFLERQKIVAFMDFAKVLSVEEGAFSWPRALFDFKGRMEALLLQALPEPEASFANGLLLGSRKGIPEKLTEAFQVVGLYHIVAISGSNISLIILLFFMIFSFLSFYKRIIASLLSIAVFVVFVGASSTVIRAGVMGSLSLWGLYFGRKSTALFGLFWSVILLVLWNPYMLLYDMGFQLSVSSTLGILVFQSPLKLLMGSFFDKLPSWAQFFKEAFLLSLSAQIATLPLMLFAFGRFSWVSPFANVLAAPLIPMAMLFAALSFFTPLSTPLAWAALWLIEQIALKGAALPGADWAVSLSWTSFWSGYLLQFLFLLLFYKSIWIRAFFRDRKEDVSIPLSLPS